MKEDKSHIISCVLTGNKENLKMYAYRLDGQIVGWYFLHESINLDDFDVKITIETKRRGSGDDRAADRNNPGISDKETRVGFRRFRLDNLS